VGGVLWLVGDIMIEKIREIGYVSQKARETFNKIRVLRKSTKAFTRAQKDELERQIKELQDQWWTECQESFTRGPHPWDGYGYCSICDKEKMRTSVDKKLEEE